VPAPPVFCGDAHQRITVEGGVDPAPTVQKVIAEAAVKNVVAVVTVERIVAAGPVEPIISSKSRHGIVTSAALDHIITSIADEEVVEARTIKVLNTQELVDAPPPQCPARPSD